MTGTRGERGSGISVLAARHDDDDDVIHWETLSLYHNYSVLLDTFDTSSWDQNLPNITFS